MAAKRLIPPKDGATVRFYRIGHGDCFLIAFAGKSARKPAYVLIDCGYKPGSSKKLAKPTTTREICENIVEATGGHVDVAIITHEHQDHVNGITQANFKNITIGKTWLAWTEDGTDSLANKLRKDFKDKLHGLAAARHRLAAAGDEQKAKRIDSLLGLELGGEDEPFVAPTVQAMLGAAGVGDNKESMKIFKDKAADGVKYIRPHAEIMTIPGAKNVRVFALGPPRQEDALKDLDPQGREEFHLAASAGGYFAAAAGGALGAAGKAPFAGRFCMPMDKALDDADYGDFFTAHYGPAPDPPPGAPAGSSGNPKEVTENPEWRRIDKDWLYCAEQLALDINSYTNNSSLVLAFELGKGGKVLLFAADAQRGNWVSWTKKHWKDGNEKITARDLLARTVLYKVGHHGSHNATLNGAASDPSPNLAWMATSGDFAGEFTAMITAVRAWAMEQAGWDHPLQAIKDALMTKACGRVFQTDTEFKAMQKPDGVSASDWKRFQSRAHGEDLFFDLKING